VFALGLVSEFIRIPLELTPFGAAQEFENPVILIHEKKINSLQAILPVLELVVRVRNSFLKCTL
jgi:chaperonin GroEL (HSP60 family)